MKLKYIFWDDDTGYGTSAKQIIKTLIEHHVKVIQVGLKHSPGQPEYTLPMDQGGDQDYDIVIIHSAPYYIHKLAEKNKINVAYCTWETTILPAMWVRVLNTCDAVFVPSSFNKRCFESSGVIKPILLLPHISEFGHWPGKAFLPKSSASHPFTFYSIGMWTNRKNNLELIQAFQQAFPANESVRLILKTSEKNYTKSAFYLLRKLGISTFNKVMDNRTIRKLLKKDPRIEIHTEVWSDHKIAECHLTSDCFISLCRSEGWGLGAYEAAWFGNPVIITGFGGQCDFLTFQDSYLLSYRLVPIQETVWTEYNLEGQQWAEINIKEVIATMRFVFLNQQEARSKGIRSMQHVASNFNAQLIIRTFIRDLEQLYGQS